MSWPKCDPHKKGLKERQEGREGRRRKQERQREREENKFHKLARKDLCTLYLYKINCAIIFEILLPYLRAVCVERSLERLLVNQNLESYPCFTTLSQTLNLLVFPIIMQTGILLFTTYLSYKSILRTNETVLKVY